MPNKNSHSKLSNLFILARQLYVRETIRGVWRRLVMYRDIFLLRKRREFDELIPALKSNLEYSIIVYQMGKVGSMSVYESLLKTYESLLKTYPNFQIYHVHMLHKLDQMEKAVRRKYENPIFTLKEIEKGRRLLERIKAAPANLPLNIITMVRDPLSQRVSDFFENMPQQIPEFEESYKQGRLTIDVIKGYFFQHPAFSSPDSNWFDHQLKPVFNIDVFETPFSKERGFQIYKNDTARILLVRTEDINRVIEEALYQFLGINTFVLRTKNRSNEKNYASLYELCKKMPLPRDYVEAVYSSRLCHHFYTEKEIERFKKHWIVA